MELIGYLLLGFSLLLALYALVDCWKDATSPRSAKVVYSILIIALPVAGAVTYFRHKEDIEDINSGNRRRRSNRRR